MKAYVFTGPTLAVADARRVLDAVYLPPAAQGDVYRAALRRPWAIGIIDGYFDSVPSIWHKEILWAMHEGIHVFGSASMGALRAAELAAFGMEGVGTIFSAYVAGYLEDDDEVAVAHGTDEMGYRALSVAMVNMRATLKAAAAAGVITAATHSSLLSVAKSLFYVERTYPRLLQAGAEAGLAAAESAALRAWLPSAQVDQKRDDALAMLRLMRERRDAGPQPRRVRYHFEHTIFWDALRRSGSDAGFTADPSGENLAIERVLDEVRLDPARYRLLYQTALNRALARALAEQQGYGMPATGPTTGEARGATNAHDPEAGTLAWLRREDELVRWAARYTAPNLRQGIIEQLHLDGSLQRVYDRVHHKQSILQAAGLDEVGLQDLGLSEGALLRWYFVDQCGGSVPDTIAEYARDTGFADESELLRVLLREFCYVRGIGVVDQGDLGG